MIETPKKILHRHGLRAKRDWGQNFLDDEEVLAEIARACSVDAADVVVELGAGLGHLTRALAATGARVVAVERDRDLVAILEAELELPNVRVVAANAAKLDFAGVAGVDQPVVAGNLPFQLSSPILFEVLEQRAHVRRAVFLLQKEVAERIAAPPGGKEYGLLSVLVQAFANVGVVLEVPARLFHPPPKVDSALLRIDMLPVPRAEVRDAARFIKLVKAAFALRRKTLWNSLRTARLVPEEALAAALKRAGIDPIRRAETLSPQEYAALARELPLMADRRRFALFARFCADRFPEARRVFDVAGGMGRLNEELTRLGREVTTFDSRHKRLEVRFVERHFSLEEPCECELVIGLHPDGATRVVVEYAARCRIPFAIVPCCSDNGMSYRPWMGHLAELAQSLTMDVEEATLPMPGRARVLVGLPRP